MLDRRHFWPGIVVGLVAGTVLTVGAIRFGAMDGAADRELYIPVDAVATASSDAFITATGPIDEDVEGIFFLDPVTGELSCMVMNIYSLKFSAVFRYDKVVDDLNLKQHKGAKLLMVTGLLNYKNATKTLRPAESVVYVVNTASGDFAAYAVPWNKNIAREDKYIGELRLLDKGKARTKAVRPT